MKIYLFGGCYRATNIIPDADILSKLRTYSCDGFLEKNADRLPLETVAGADPLQLVERSGGVCTNLPKQQKSDVLLIE